MAVQPSVMGDRGKIDLEDLKKSFPSLDDFSAKRLLGGGNPHSEATDESVFYEPGGNPATPIFTPSVYSSSGGPATASGGGSDYFGDTTPNDWGEMHDAGWGDGGYDVGDSNPGGSEGGNGQNSSGNPGGGDEGNGLWIGGRVWHNRGELENRPYTLRNDTSQTIYYKTENGGDAVPLLPGGETNDPIDGFKVGNSVYHVVDGYNWVHVEQGSFTTNYVNNWDYLLFFWFGWILWPPDIYWQPLFDAP